jgi:hypothetical protein
MGPCSLCCDHPRLLLRGGGEHKEQGTILRFCLARAARICGSSFHVICVHVSSSTGSADILAGRQAGRQAGRLAPHMSSRY